MSTAQHTKATVDVTPDELAAWLASGDVALVDIREGFEHAAERIPGGELLPLDSVRDDDLHDLVASRDRVCFYCRTGRRSAEALRRVNALGARAFHLAGGIEAWREAGHATERSASAPKMDPMRQTQIAMGTLVVTGVILGLTVHTAFHGLSAFVGAGMVFAGATGSCAMAKWIARLPWNRTDCSTGVCGR